MLGNPPMLTIHRGHRRPAAALLERSRRAQTGHLVDAMDGRGDMDWRIKPLDPANAAFVCPALTAFACPADVVGDLVIGMMRNKGIAAFRGPAAVLCPQREPCTGVAQADGGQALARRRRACSARVSWSGMPPALPRPAPRGHGPV